MEKFTIVHNLFYNTKFTAHKRLVQSFIFMLFLINSAITPAQTPGDMLVRPLLGEEKVLFILVNYPDDSTPVMTYEQTVNHANTVAAIMEANSYGSHTFDVDVTPVLTMPQPKSFYELDDRKSFVRMRADALFIAEQNGFTVEEYDREAIFTKKLWPQPYGAAGGFNFRTIFSSKKNKAPLSAHEFGHTYDWNHANYWKVSSSNPLDTNGMIVNYGDKFDIMGDHENPHHYNPWFKWRVGWLPDESIKTVTESGNYVIRGLEMDPAAAPANTYSALRIRRSPESEFIVYYRSQEPFANTGALISVAGVSNNKPILLLDMTPGSQNPGDDYKDAALLPGITVQDNITGIGLTVLEKYDDSLLVNVVVPPGTIDVLPILNFVSPDAGVTIKGGVDYEVTAYDPDFGNENGAGIEKVKFALGWVKGDNPYIPEGTEFIALDSGQITSPPYLFHAETEGFPDEVYRMKITAFSQDGGKNIATFKHIIDNTGPSVTSAVKEATDNPIRLEQNTPNPFAESTAIAYHLNRPGQVTLCVYDMFGRKVRTLVQKHQAAGRHTVSWDGSDSSGESSSGGLYFCELRMGEFVASKRLLLLR